LGGPHNRRDHGASFSSPTPSAEMEGAKLIVADNSGEAPPAEGVGAANGPREAGSERRAPSRKRPPCGDNGSAGS
jgi:hypothetical protein